MTKTLKNLVSSALIVVLAIPHFVFASQTETYGQDYPLYDEGNYIDWYDLNIVDVFDFYEEHQLLLLEDEELFAEFLEARAIMEIQAPAVEAYNILVSNFWQYVNGYQTLIFPETYAGAWVDYGTLVIQVTDLSPETLAFYHYLVGLDAPVRFERVDFSYNQLISFGEVFVDYLGDVVIGWGVNTKANTYAITLYENFAQSTAIYNAFDDFSRFVPIPLEVSIGAMNYFSMLMGGSALGSGSVGFTGFRSGTAQAALLISGHVVVGADGMNVVRNGQTIGSVQVLRFANVASGNPGTTHGDWAVVNLNATGAALVTNQLRSGGRINGFQLQTPVNTTVNAIGRFTQTSGVVVAVNQSFTAPLGNQMFTVSGLTRVNTFGTRPMPGDSGGPVFTNNILRGIIVSVSGTLPTWYFSPLQHSANHFTPRITN